MVLSRLTKKYINNSVIIFLSLSLFSFGFLLGCRNEVKQEQAEAEPRPPVEVNSAVDKAVATTGDILTYTVTVDRLPEVEAYIPEIGAEITGFRIVDIGADGPQEEDGRIITKEWYKLQADIVGSYIIPPVKLTYKLKPAAEYKEMQTKQIFVEIKSAIPTGEEQKDIIDIKPLEEPQIDYGLWSAIIGGAAAVILLIVGGIIYYRKSKQAAEVYVKLPAHEVALAELSKLGNVEYTDAQEIKKLYFNLSEVFRSYLENRYGFPATDWTSEEITSHINKNRELTFDLKEQSKSFLYNTDVVKFAEYTPVTEQIQDELNRAAGFVEATREVAAEEVETDAV